MTRLSVSGPSATNASATARRAVGGFSLTSTIRGRPVRSTWVRRRRSKRGAGPGPRSMSGAMLRRVAYGASSHQSSTGSPARCVSIASGTTASASAAASADRTWLPCPAGPLERRTRTRPFASRDGSAVRVALRGDAQERAPALARCGPRRGGRPDRPAEAGRGGPRARGSPAGRTARTSRSSTPGCRAARTAARDRHRIAARCRTRTACRAGPRRATAPISPTASKASFTTSYGPTETPPATTIASAPAVERRPEARARPRRGRPGAMPRSIGSAPEASTRARRPGPFASGIPAGPRSVPAGRTSLPVASTATRGRRRTCRLALPAPAASATAAGESAVPEARIAAPSTRSLPRAPDVGARRDRGVHEDRRRQGPYRVSPPCPRGARGIERRRLLDRDHRVGARWDRRAGRDANRAPVPHGVGPRRRPPGPRR